MLLEKRQFRVSEGMSRIAAMCHLSVTPFPPCPPPTPPTEGVNFALRPYPFFYSPLPPPPPTSTEGLNFALRPRLILVRLQVVGAPCWFGTLPSVLMRNRSIFPSNLPKCLKWLQKALIMLCCCF